jgi:hypothetical protein
MTHTLNGSELTRAAEAPAPSRARETGPRERPSFIPADRPPRL